MHEIQPDWNIIVSNCFEHWCFPFMDTKLNWVYSCRNSFWWHDWTWFDNSHYHCMNYESCHKVDFLCPCPKWQMQQMFSSQMLSHCHKALTPSTDSYRIFKWNNWKMKCLLFVASNKPKFLIISLWMISFNSEEFSLSVIVWLTFYIIIVLGFRPHLNVTCQLDQEEFLD